MSRWPCQSVSEQLLIGEHPRGRVGLTPSSTRPLLWYTRDVGLKHAFTISDPLLSTFNKLTKFCEVPVLQCVCQQMAILSIK